MKLETNFVIENTGLYPIDYSVDYNEQYYTIYPPSYIIPPHTNLTVYLSSPSSVQLLPPLILRNNHKDYSDCYRTFTVDNEIKDADCKYEHIDYKLSECINNYYEIEFSFIEPKYCDVGVSLPEKQLIRCSKENLILLVKAQEINTYNGYLGIVVVTTLILLILLLLILKNKLCICISTFNFISLFISFLLYFISSLFYYNNYGNKTICFFLSFLHLVSKIIFSVTMCQILFHDVNSILF